MNVLQLGRFYPPSKGGIQTAMLNIREGLVEHGVRGDVLCCGDSIRSCQEPARNGTIYRAGSLGTWLSTSLSPALVMRLAMIASRYDIIHLQHPDPMATLALFMVRPKAKIVVHWQSDIVRQKFALRFFKPLQDWLLKRAAAIIVTTPPYLKSQFLQPYLAKTEVIPIGISEHVQRADPALVQRIVTAHKGQHLIFALGRMVYYKGFEYLIRAGALLPDNIHIVIGGGGPLLEKMRLMVDDLGVGDRVFLLGVLSDDEINAYYEACAAFCLSSTHLSEAFGIVQLECMRVGKPVIATTIADSGVSWVNADRVSGINVAPCDEAKLAEAIRELVTTEGLAQKLGKQANQRFHSLFTRPRMCQGIYNMYLRCLDPSHSQ